MASPPAAVLHVSVADHGVGAATPAGAVRRPALQMGSKWPEIHGIPGKLT